MHHKENASRKLFYLFILSCIPVFFIISLAGLYFIQLEEWVKGEGEIIPVQKNILYLTRTAKVKEIRVKAGDIVKKNQILAVFEINSGARNKMHIFLKSKQDGIILKSTLNNLGIILKQGKPIFTIASNEVRSIKISISEKDFVKLKLDQKVRYEPNTVSINANDYYWGALKRITPVATELKDKKGNALFMVEGKINHYGDQSINSKSLHHIPFGSTGKVAIGIGKKSLLLQLIGWN